METRLNESTNQRISNREWLEPDGLGGFASGTVNGNVLTLKLKEASAATKITYLKEIKWNQDTLRAEINPERWNRGGTS